EKEPVKVLAVEYHGRDLNHTAQSYKPGEKPLPDAVEAELARRDGVLRMAAKTATGAARLLSFELSELRPKGPFLWTFRTDLLYALYSGEFKGTVAVFDGKALKTVATFTVAYDATTFNVREK